MISSALLLTTPAALDTNLLRGVTLEGSSEGGAVLLSPTSGTGFPMIRNNSYKTCTGGTGSCDVRLNNGASGRGAGCICNVNLDCASNVCAGAVTSLHNVRIGNLGLEIRNDNMVGIDFSCIGESLIDHVHVAGQSGLTHTNTVGLLMGDDNVVCSGYSNTITASRFNSLDVCAWVRKAGNDERFISDVFSAACGSGVVLENGVGDNKITHSLLQSTAVAVCGAPCTAATCCGGHFHGKTCTVAADCQEADIVILGQTNFVDFNHFEDSNNTHIHLGENSTTCPTCGAFTAQENVIRDNLHTGTGTPIVAITSKNQRPYVSETIFDQTKMMQLFSQPPPWTPYGFVESMGQQKWAWQVRDVTGALDAIGMAAPVQTGTTAAFKDSTGHYVLYQAGTVNGNTAGLTPAGGTYNAFESQVQPMVAIAAKTGTVVTNLRLWFGIFSGDPSGSATPTLSYLAFRYDDLAGDGTTWKVCTDSGTGTPNNAGACADTGITVTANTRYDFMIYSGATNGVPAAAPTFYINGAIVANSTTPLPAATTQLHAAMMVTTTGGAVNHSFRFGRIACAIPGRNIASIP